MVVALNGGMDESSACVLISANNETQYTQLPYLVEQQLLAAGVVCVKRLILMPANITQPYHNIDSITNEVAASLICLARNSCCRLRVPNASVRALFASRPVAA